jgi:hypothetical protein
MKRYQIWEIGEPTVFLPSYLRDVYICMFVLPCHFAIQGPICHLGTCPAESLRTRYFWQEGGEIEDESEDESEDGLGTDSHIYCVP